MTRYEVEQHVDNIKHDIMEQFDIDDPCFFGDCYSRELMELENQLELAKDEWEIEYYSALIRNCFFNEALQD